MRPSQASGGRRDERPWRVHQARLAARAAGEASAHGERTLPQSPAAASLAAARLSGAAQLRDHRAQLVLGACKAPTVCCGLVSRARRAPPLPPKFEPPARESTCAPLQACTSGARTCQRSHLSASQECQQCKCSASASKSPLAHFKLSPLSPLLVARTSGPTVATKVAASGLFRKYGAILRKEEGLIGAAPARSALAVCWTAAQTAIWAGFRPRRSRAALSRRVARGANRGATAHPAKIGVRLLRRQGTRKRRLAQHPPFNAAEPERARGLRHPQLHAQSSPARSRQQPRAENKRERTFACRRDASAHGGRRCIRPAGGARRVRLKREPRAQSCCSAGKAAASAELPARAVRTPHRCLCNGAEPASLRATSLQQGANKVAARRSSPRS